MTKKLTGRALAKFESARDIWKEVLAGVEEIKASTSNKIPISPPPSQTSKDKN